MEVQESPAKELYFEPGWGSYEKLRLKAGFREKNLFGTGRIFGLDAAVSFKAQSLVAESVRPLVPEHRHYGQICLYITAGAKSRHSPAKTGRVPSVFEKINGSFKRIRGICIPQDGRVTHRSGHSRRRCPGPTTIVPASSFRQPTTVAMTCFFLPEGQRSFISAEHADTFLGGDITFTRLTGGVRFFIPLTHATVLGMRYRTGLIVPGSDDVTLPMAEKIF